MTALYLDLVGGLAGDMLLAALLDLGCDIEEVRAQMAALPLSGYRFEVSEEIRRGFRGRRVAIPVTEPQPHRTLRDVRAVLGAGGLSDEALGRASAIFDHLARAEARVHGIEVDRVHFHEVGAVDSILDIAGISIVLDRLGIGEIWAGEVPLGSGTVVTHHGEIPVPAPATVELLQGWPVRFTGGGQELVTPTAAAVLAALARPGPPSGVVVLRKTGIGFGSRHPAEGPPNLVRALLLGATSAAAFVDVVEATVDDMPAEWIGFLTERLLESGALDVFCQGVQMKKNRPGTLITALGEPGDADRIAGVFFEHSTTLGVRIRRDERRELARRIESVDTPLGRVRVKVASRPDGADTAAPEFEDCREIARARGIPIENVYRATEEAWRRNR